MFDYQHGLNVAVAVTSYDGNNEKLLDPSYGKLIFEHAIWGINESGEFFTKYDPIQPHICSREELGLEGPEQSKFYAHEEDTKQIVEMKHRQFYCLSEDQLRINGNY